MEDWLSVSQLSKTLNIPETTIRRYLNNFEEYFLSEQIGRGRKFNPRSIEILQRIALLYSRDYETAEIKRMLADEFPYTVENHNNHDTPTHPPAYDVSGKLDVFQKQQEEFNKLLLKQLQEQQIYVREMAANRLVNQEDKRIERFEQILAERKVTKLLEEEAMSVWQEKPKEEREKKVGWFRTEEDRDKRDDFIKDYVDEHFETYLIREFDIEK